METRSDSSRSADLARIFLAVTTLACAGPVLALASAGPAGPVKPGPQAEERYVRAKDTGAKLLNYRDVQSSVWRTVPSGEVLRVTDEQVLEPPGQAKLVFLEVEAPGGLPVWIFGQYLEPSGTAGVLRTTATVNMRPKPAVDLSSMAHPMKLDKGQHVRFIERANDSKAWNEDWIKVWSPENARAWVLATETESADTALAREEWKRASALLRGPSAGATEAPAAAATSSDATKGVPAEAASSASGDDAKQALDEARTLYDTAVQNDGVNIGAAVAAFERAIELASPGTATRRQAEQGLEQAKFQADIVAVRAQMQAADEEKVRLLAELEREEALDQRSRDPLWGRFTARGWVIARADKEGVRYFVNWKNQDVCEVVTGRYDLSLFEGYEIGVMGTVSRNGVPAAFDQPAQLELLDLYRVEVISGGGRKL